MKFSDGSEFTADDAKFSLERAKAKSSNFAVYTQGIDRVERSMPTPSTSIPSCPTPCW